MALDAKDIPITRELVSQWCADWEFNPVGTLRDYITAEVNAMNLADPYLDVGARNDIPGEVIHIVDVIMADMPSYGWTTDGNPLP